MKVAAYQIAESIDTKAFRQEYTAELHYADSDELFYGIEGDAKFMYVFRYGVVCFFNHTEVEEATFLKWITNYCRNLLPNKFSDAFQVNTGASKIIFDFNSIQIPEPEKDVMRLVMLHLSQSVALDYFESETNRLMEETNLHTQTLEHRGKLGLSSLELKKYIGKTMNLKNRIAKNLYIFDSPEATWESEQLDKLDAGLKKTFDLVSRSKIIEDGLEVVKENLDLFKDLLQNRQSNFLEWIIILLILVEVINLFIEKLF